MVSFLFWICFVGLTKSQLMISINAHGGYYGAKATSVIDWPYNVDVIFFVRNGLELDNREGLQVTRAYETGMYDIIRRVQKVEVIGPGGKMPDYIFEYGLEFATTSGVYGVDERIRDSDPLFWFQLTPGFPIRLVDFVDQYIHKNPKVKGKTTILWNACRVYMGAIPPKVVTSYPPDTMTTFRTIKESKDARVRAFKQCRADLKRAMMMIKQRIAYYIKKLSSRITSKLSPTIQKEGHQYIEQVEQDMEHQFVLPDKAVAKADVWQCNVICYNEQQKLELLHVYYMKIDKVIVRHTKAKKKKKTDHGADLIDKMMSAAAESASVAHKQIDNYYGQYTQSAHSEYGNKLTYHDNDLQSNYPSQPVDYYSSTYYPSISLLLLFVSGVLVFISICCVVNCALCYLLGVSDIFNICRGYRKYREDDMELQGLNQL